MARFTPARSKLAPLEWVSSVASATGNREENQDSFWGPDPNFSSEEAVFVVADGMGGGQFGKWAAQEAVHAVVNALRASLWSADTCSIPDRLREAISQANARVHALQLSAQREHGSAQVGCALAAGVLRRQTLAIAHVGDVRAYLWRQGTLNALTKDHSWAVTLGEDDFRSEGLRHVLSRAIGPQAVVEPDIITCSVESGDVVILCTDGVWSVLPEEQMARLIASTKPEALANRLVQAALEQSTNDNATALVVALREKRSFGVKPLVFIALALLVVLFLVATWVVLIFLGAKPPLKGTFSPSAESAYGSQSVSQLASPSAFLKDSQAALDRLGPRPAVAADSLQNTASSRPSTFLPPQAFSTAAEERTLQPTATLVVVPAAKLCTESDFNMGLRQCVYSTSEIPRFALLYLSWEPTTAQLERIEIRRNGSRTALNQLSLRSGEGYARIRTADLAFRLQPGAAYVMQLYFADVARPVEISFAVRR